MGYGLRLEFAESGPSDDELEALGNLIYLVRSVDPCTQLQNLYLDMAEEILSREATRRRFFVPG
jgi:hypothetical protein